MLTIKNMCNRGVPVFSGRFPSHPDRRSIPYRIVFDRQDLWSNTVYPTASSWSPICGADWQCSAVRLGGAGGDLSKICSGSDVIVRRAVFSPFEPLDGVHCYVSVTCLSSVKALHSVAPQNSQRCWGWNVRCSLEGLAYRGKVMARSSSEKKVPQLILSVKKSHTGDTYRLPTPLWDAQLWSEATTI